MLLLLCSLILVPSAKVIHSSRIILQVNRAQRREEADLKVQIIKYHPYFSPFLREERALTLAETGLLSRDVWKSPLTEGFNFF